MKDNDLSLVLKVINKIITVINNSIAIIKKITTLLISFLLNFYYKTEDGVKLLIESNYTENITIDESNGYEEYFCDLFDTDKVYIDLISLKDLNVTSTFKLEFKKVLKNNKLYNPYKSYMI